MTEKQKDMFGKNRNYGDRGTGYTPRKQSIPGTTNEKRYGRGARWCRRCGCYVSIQKYDLLLCRQCFREVATSLGFKKLR